MPEQKELKRILIADDHDVVRAGLRRIVSREFGELEFVEAEDSDELLAKAKECQPDLILSDIKMPGRGGIQILKEIRSFDPEMQVIILTAFPETEYGAQAMEAGAAGFINKANVKRELPGAIRMVMEGRRFVSAKLAEALADYLGRGELAEPHVKLSARELEVTQLIATGLETIEIAQKLGLSDKTIATYRARVYEKLNVKNNVELTRYALQHMLVD
jgi:two-component system, NarL family, invasion response regulator UvrY